MILVMKMSPSASLSWDTTLAGNTSLVLPGLGLFQNAPGTGSQIKAGRKFNLRVKIYMSFKGFFCVSCVIFRQQCQLSGASWLCVSYVTFPAAVEDWKCQPASYFAKGACERSKNTLARIMAPEKADCAWFGFLFPSECQPGVISPSSAGSY